MTKLKFKNTKDKNWGNRRQVQGTFFFSLLSWYRKRKPSDLAWTKKKNPIHLLLMPNRQ